MKFDDKKSGSLGNAKKNNIPLYGVVLLLAVGFFVLVGLVFIFAGTTSFGMDKCVGVIEINGEITTQSMPSSLFAEGIPGSEDIAQEIKSLKHRDEIGALVIVMNSPGGSVVGSREIYDSIKEMNKTSVAYFREVAASGGYYISTATDYIVSDPDALTGSIGVIMTTVEMSGLFEKIGVNITNIVSGKHKDIGSPDKPMTEEEYAILYSLIEDTYSDFKSKVIEGRKGKLDMTQFENITDGRVLSGRQAKEVGLVDLLGTKEDAIKKAAELAGINAEEPRICKIKAVPYEGTGSPFGMETLLTKVLSNLDGKISISLR